ncbi:RNA-directed DNA polymerase, eukaryota, reverse transcriptase zinc-binding domain protein [Tanacetum coccineum]
MESIRSRFFNGVDIHSKKPSWVRWKNVMASKDKGGLGVSSLFALNRALMFKWVWRFISQSSSLWARVIKALHGEDGKIGKKVKSTYPSIWLNIIHEVELLKLQGIDLLSFIHSKLGNGANTSFWEVAWRGDSAFKDLFPRMYALESLKSINVASKLSHCGLAFSFRRNPRGGVEQAQFDLLKEKVEGCVLVDMFDRWVWSLEGSAVPIKVNVHAWKVKLDCLPTRFNISRRGMDIESILCPICGNAVESSRHLFFTCRFSSELMRKISRWWDIDYMEISSYEEWLDWILNLRLSLKHKQILEVITMANLVELEFPALDASGENYFMWASNVKRYLAAEGLKETLKEGNSTSLQDRAKAMVFICRHLDEDLRFQYITVRDPLELMKCLVNRYECLKQVMLPKARNDWILLSFQDFETQQYRERGFKTYYELIPCLLIAEHNNELVMKSHQSIPAGYVAFPEVNARSFDLKREREPLPKADASSCSNKRGRDENDNACYKCGSKNHWSRTCRTPKHLCELYQASLLK